MTRSVPVWSIPFLLILMGIVAVLGHLPLSVLVITSLETVVVAIYLILRSRSGDLDIQPVSNLLSLFPGHLLVLLIIALLDRPGMLAWLWTFIPLLTLLYDGIGRNHRLTGSVRISISTILYVILWADLFFLLERAVALHRHLSGSREIMIAAAVGLAGALFLSLGVMRHRMAAKE